MQVADIKEILVQWDAGGSISDVSRRLGYSRPTVRKDVETATRLGLVRGSRSQDETTWETLARQVIATVAQPRPPGEASVEVRLFHTYLDEHVGRVRLSVLHQRLQREQGLQASWATLYRYVRQHWPERLGQSAASRATIRLDDPPPGDEAQVDFFYVGRWQDRDAGKERRLYAFLMTLSHSRHTFLYPVLGEDSVAWLAAHVAAFTFFGGVPRRLVPDNLTAGIIKPDRYDPRLNRAYGELTRYYGCVVDPSRVAHPKDKPKVERPVDYARESFFRGRDFPDLLQMRQDAVGWCRDIAGQRVHGTTRERPLVAFHAREQAALLPLPLRPWELVTWTTGKVHPDCHVQIGGVRYSVPYRYIGQQVDLRLGERTVGIYLGAELLALHVRGTAGRVTQPDHYPEAGRAFLQATPAACLEQAQAIGPALTTLVRTLLADATLHRLREVRAVLRLADQVEPVRLERACQRALDVGDARLRTVRGLLERGLDAISGETDPLPPPTPIGAYLRGPDAFAVTLAVADQSSPADVAEAAVTAEGGG
jgi:transposase